jgi:hypothetical protein
MRRFVKYALMVVLCLVLVAAYAQTGTCVDFKETKILSDKLVVRIPCNFKKNRVVEKRAFKVRQAVAYNDGEGSKLIFYHTTRPWNEKGKEIWDVAFEAASSFGNYRFIKSGFFSDKHTQDASIFFLQIQVTGEHGKEHCALLTFSELENKLLYTIYSSPGDNYDVWAHVSDQLIRNQYALK